MAHENLSTRSNLWTESVRFELVESAPEKHEIWSAPAAGYIVSVWGTAGTIAASGTITLDCEINDTTCLSTAPALSTANTPVVSDINGAEISTSANTFSKGDKIRLEALANANKTADDVNCGFVAVLTGP